MKQILVVILSILSLSLWAQGERKYVREGNEAYYDGKPDKAVESYQKALEEAPESPEAHFNLGNAYYKQKEFEKATASFQTAAGLFKDDEQKAKALHNIGNAYLDQQKFKEAKEAYQQALRLNPKDNDTRYNLAMANKMLQKKEQEQEQQNKDQEKQDKEQDEENQKEQQKEQKDQGEKEQEDKQEGEEKKSDDKDSQEKENGDKKDSKPEESKDGGDQEKEAQPQAVEGQISKEEAERMLEALKNEEQKLQEKLMLMQKRKGKRKNLEKDW